jgi:hypothetical protein
VTAHQRSQIEVRLLHVFSAPARNDVERISQVLAAVDDVLASSVPSSVLEAEASELRAALDGHPRGAARLAISARLTNVEDELATRRSTARAV